MAEHREVFLSGRPRCKYIGGQGHIEFDLDDGKIASITCDVLPGKPEPVVDETVQNLRPAPTEKPKLVAVGENGPAGVPGKDPEEEVDGAQKPLRGKLPDKFPAKKELEAAGITTYGQLRKERAAHDQSLTHIDGIAEGFDLQISEALGEHKDVDSEDEAETAT